MPTEPQKRGHGGSGETPDVRCLGRQRKTDGTGLVFLAEEGETEMTTVFIRNKYNKAIENALELPAWVWGGVSDLSRLQGVSPSTVMKRAISAYIAR